MYRSLRVIRLIAVLGIILFGAFGFTSSQKYTLTIHLTQLRNSSGQIALLVHDASNGFPESDQKAVRRKLVPAKKNGVTITFDDLPPGNYAVTVLHDENSTGKADKNFIGIPTEGFGFSNNPVIRFGIPDFDDCKIEVNKTTSHTIRLKYF